MGKQKKKQKLLAWLEKIYEKPLNQRKTATTTPTTTATATKPTTAKRPKRRTKQFKQPSKILKTLDRDIDRAKDTLKKREIHRAKMELNDRNKELDKLIARDEEIAELRREANQQRQKQGKAWTEDATHREWEEWTEAIQPERHTRNKTTTRPAPKPMIKTDVPLTTKYTILVPDRPVNLSPIKPVDEKTLLQDLELSPVPSEMEDELLRELDDDDTPTTEETGQQHNK